MTAYILNLIDLVFTLYAVSYGGVELNPLMRCAPVMIFYKTVVVGALLGWLSKRDEPFAHMGLKLCTVAYAAVMVWHIVNIAPLLSGAFLLKE